MTPDARAKCRQMRSLREQLKISRSDFAAVLGMAGKRVENREYEISPWTPEEIDHARQAIQAHIFAAAQALQSLTD